MKKFLVVVLALMLTISVACADSFRVFDSADLFTPEEEEAMEAAILDYRYSTRTDFCVLTTDDFLGYADSYTFAESFYVRMDIGIGTAKDGFLVYIDMNNRTPAIVTWGLTYKVIPNDELNAIFDAMHPYLVSGDYAQGIMCAMEAAQTKSDAYWSALIEP